MLELDNDQISVPTWLEGLENIKYRNGIHGPVNFRDPVGSMEGPRLVCNPMGAGSFVLSLEPLDMFLLIRIEEYSLNS